MNYYFKLFQFLLITSTSFVLSVEKNVFLFINGDPGSGKSAIIQAITIIDGQYGFCIIEWDVFFTYIIPCLSPKLSPSARRIYAKYLELKVKGSKIKMKEGPMYQNFLNCMDAFIGNLVATGNNVIYDRCLLKLPKIPVEVLDKTKVYLILIKSDNAIEAAKARHSSKGIGKAYFSAKADTENKYDLVIENNRTPEDAARQILEHISNNEPKAVYEIK